MEVGGGALGGLVPAGGVRVGGEVVAEGAVFRRQRRGAGEYVQVVAAYPGGVLDEEQVVGILGEGARAEGVPVRHERPDLDRAHVGHDRDDVDDGLGGHAGHAGRADVLDAQRTGQRGGQQLPLAGEERGPRRVVRHDHDHPVHSGQATSGLRADPASARIFA
jgi:hypothetical protein